MNENMKNAFVELTQAFGEQDLDVFLRTWQLAMAAEREQCAKIADGWSGHYQANEIAASIRARGQK